MAVAGHEGQSNDGQSKEGKNSRRSLIQTDNHNYRVVVVGPVEQVVIHPHCQYELHHNMKRNCTNNPVLSIYIPSYYHRSVIPSYYHRSDIC